MDPPNLDLSPRILAVFKFTVFNVFLGLADVLTDLFTLFFLMDDHVLWASLTALWMLTPFIVHTATFLFK